MITRLFPARGRPAQALALAVFLAALGACGDSGADSQRTEAETEPVAGDTAPAMAMDTGMAATDTEALLDPNDASEEELMALPGLDSAAVAMILDGRPFESMVALNAELSARMDSAALDQLYRRMFIPVNLNEASEEEILLIPGVGERMAYEFREYRPYQAMAQFRREIGKYVDDGEVARLERYVTLD